MKRPFHSPRIAVFSLALTTLAASAALTLAATTWQTRRIHPDG